MNWKGFFIGLDQAVNCLIRIGGEYGLPDEMLSARAWRMREQRPKLHVWIDRLFFWDKDHCKECYELEQAREQHPLAYRND